MKSRDSQERDSVIYTPRRPKQPGHDQHRPRSGRREYDLTVRRKIYLTEQLGSKCAWCGSIDNLQFDVADGNTRGHHDMSYADRLVFYEQELRRGNLQLLCPPCHRRKTAHDQAVLSLKRLLTEEVLATRGSPPEAVKEQMRLEIAALLYPFTGESLEPIPFNLNKK